MTSTSPSTSTVATGRLKASETTVANITAARAPGTACACFGSFFHSTMTAMVPAPIASEVMASVLPSASVNAPGSPAILPMPVSGAFRPAAA